MIIYLLALVTSAGLVVLVVGLAPVLPLSEPKVTIEDRISTFGVASLTRLDEDEETASFYERVVAPMTDRVRRYVARNTPEATQQDLEARLELAGRPYGIGAEDFVVLRAAAGLTGLTLGLIVGWVVQNGVTAALLGLMLAAGAYLLPGYWLSRQVDARRREIVAALPPVLDMLVVAVDAGLSFDLALARVVEKLHNPLTLELDQVQREISLGRPRSEALEGLAMRASVEDVKRLVNALLQADQLGVPIARALRAQAGEARRLARQRAQQLAAQAPVKMVIPMIVCILPTVWLILLGPALVDILVHGI